jgi:hypothetical protein
MTSGIQVIRGKTTRSTNLLAPQNRRAEKATRGVTTGQGEHVAVDRLLDETHPPVLAETRRPQG